MLAKRIIPCLDCDLSVPNGRVVKGTKFKQIRYAGVPWELAKQYYEQGADEICFLDITASADKRETMARVVEETCREVFVPVTVGGGIKSVEDANKVFKVGADKVSINTAAIKQPKLVSELSRRFGSQAVVVAIDARRKGSFWECSIYGGRKFTGIDALQWAKKAESLGAGEILLTSMDKDGTKEGFDLELTRAVSEAVNIPVIASGGAGSLESIAAALSAGKADAALAASIFHFGEYTPNEVKEFLAKKQIKVRL
ncbi:MAG: imidazole glycerol phosphate synthase subunit HisF [Candidatus Diapherotrites archaeon]|nr:imidazole glycerol phosphate synthase subunit HisF [Candidatus Diapherotrites archaeon]